jgi:hypothetical protein
MRQYVPKNGVFAIPLRVSKSTIQEGTTDGDTGPRPLFFFRTFDFACSSAFSLFDVMILDLSVCAG